MHRHGMVQRIELKQLGKHRAGPIYWISIVMNGEPNVCFFNRQHSIQQLDVARLVNPDLIDP